MWNVTTFPREDKKKLKDFGGVCFFVSYPSLKVGLVYIKFEYLLIIFRNNFTPCKHVANMLQIMALWHWFHFLFSSRSRPLSLFSHLIIIAFINIKQLLINLTALLPEHSDASDVSDTPPCAITQALTSFLDIHPILISKILISCPSLWFSHNSLSFKKKKPDM